MAVQIRRVCQAYCHVRGIATIRKCLSTIACKTIIHALVMSRLDYDNTMLYGLPETQTAETADGSKLRGTADYWNPQTRSHNTSFIQFTLVACSSANRIQTSFTCVSRCASSLPSVSVVACDSIHTHPNTEIRRSTFIDYTTVPSRAVRSSGLFCGRANTVERPTPAIRQANSVARIQVTLENTYLLRSRPNTLLTF